jgi:hypothetical protein
MVASYRHRLLTALSLALVVGAGCGDGGPSGNTLRVLFIGNSLTFYNDLPAMVRDLADVDGSVAIDVRDVSRGGYALEDHWVQPTTRDALAEGGWDVVVLQQGPSSLPESRANLVQWARTWAEAIRAQGAEPALYMVWPDRGSLARFDDVSNSYRIAADSAGAALYPAGDAWQEAWARDSSLALFGTDEVHPSVMGSYLAALTIYRALTGRDPPGLIDLGFSNRDEAILQTAAQAAVANAATPR